MNELFLFGVFPYAAVAVAGVGVAARRRYPTTLGTRSSEFLEKRALFWGSVPWHYAILLILGGHLAAAVAPGAWGALVADPRRLVVLEIAGTALGLWATFAVALLVRVRDQAGQPRDQEDRVPQRDDISSFGASRYGSDDPRDAPQDRRPGAERGDRRGRAAGEVAKPGRLPKG